MENENCRVRTVLKRDEQPTREKAHREERDPGSASCSQSKQPRSIAVRRSFHGGFLKGTGAGGEEPFRRDMRDAFSHISVKNLFLAGSADLGGVYLLTGIYVVNPGEAAVVRLFGKVDQDGSARVSLSFTMAV